MNSLGSFFMVKIWRLLGLVVCVGLAMPALADPAASDWVSNEQGRVRLISAVAATGDAASLQLGLEFDLKPDWKIYWRSPGDAGYPPSIDWKGSENLEEAVISWPAPHRFSISGLETMGYKEDVVLPLIVRLSQPGKKASLHAAIDYLTCAVVCVPQHADLTLNLPAGPAGVTPHAYLISKFQSAVPGDGARQGLSLVSAQSNDGGDLVVTVAADPALKHPDLFLERADQMQFARPVVKLQQGGKRVVFKVKPVEGTGEAGLTEKPVVLTIVDGDRGMEVTTDVAAPEPGVRLPRLLFMMGVALLGGLILNLMPCVLPVLSLKILSVVSHGGSDGRTIRASFLATAAGILVSFLILASATATLKLAGSAVGWGLQFQQPLFLCVMTALVTLFAANLFGWFEVPLPQFLGDLGGSGATHGVVGHFATGAFATLLATPCSAPFLGTALGFALANGLPEIFSIFTLLGIGMALPYLAVAAFPKLAQRLPRPGKWMMRVKLLLGLLLLGTAGWLVSVVAALLGFELAIGMGAVMLAALVLLALVRGKSAALRLPVMGGTVIAAIAISFFGQAPAAGGHKGAPTGMWKPWDQAAIAQEVQAGHLVFVDVTAEWCLTCQVNKATVVYRGEVAKRLTAPGIVAMQADWTRPNDEIAAYLASFGRYGIPFDAVYGPGAPDGIPLPELLTEEDVLQALDKAAKPIS
jgi:suppressor for copper-sensitivity B